MWNTLKAIKDEALATAKELRDAHNPEHWDNEDQGDNDNTYPFQAPASVPLAPAPLYSTLPQPPPAAAAIAPPPTIPVPPTVQPPAAAPAAVPAPKEDDVTSRLAALKAKLAAKTTAPRTNSTEPSPAAATAAAPAAPAAAVAPPAAAVVDTSAITNLQRQLEEERRHFAAQLEASRKEADHQATQCISLQTALTAAETRAAEAEEVTRAHHDATDEDHERAISALRAEIQSAQEEAMTERSKAAVVASQVVELQERIDRAEAAAAAASSGDHNELENELVAAKMEGSALREELERVRSLNAASASSPQPPSSVGNGGGDGSEATTAAELEAVRSELTANKQSLATAEADKNAARQQLSRLKTQMLSEQDDEEEKIKWRVEAEVKLALEKMGRASGGSRSNGANGDGSNDNTDDELLAALERAQRAEDEAARWEDTASARDAELANLQRALGEMSYESDAAERYRAELRAMQAEVHTLRNELDAARVSSLSAENKVQQAQNEVAAARGEVKGARDAETEAKREVLAARVAAQEALKELQDLRKGGGTVDRSAVVQLIAGVMVQKRPKDALSFALHAIDLSPEEVETIKIAARLNGGGKNSGGTSVGGVSLASSWIDFLESAVQEDGSTNVGIASSLPPPPAAAAVPYSVPKSRTDPSAVASTAPPVAQ